MSEAKAFTPEERKALIAQTRMYTRHGVTAREYRDVMRWDATVCQAEAKRDDLEAELVKLRRERNVALRERDYCIEKRAEEGEL